MLYLKCEKQINTRMNEQITGPMNVAKFHPHFSLQG